MKALTDTKDETIFEAIKSYSEEKEIPSLNMLQIAPNAITGKYNEFIVK